MIKVEVSPNQATITTRSGISKANGQPYTIQEQRAYIYLGGAYPVEFVINIPQSQPPYPSGNYELSIKSLRVGSFGRLEVSRDIVLLPVDKKA